jgi:hypothetical protein
MIGLHKLKEDYDEFQLFDEGEQLIHFVLKRIRCIIWIHSQYRDVHSSSCIPNVFNSFLLYPCRYMNCKTNLDQEKMEFFAGFIVRLFKPNKAVPRGVYI